MMNLYPMISHIRKAFILLLAMSAPLSVNADAIIHTVENKNGEEATSQILITSGKIGVIEDNNEDNAVNVLFDSATSSLTFINHQHRQYTVISEAWMREAKQKMQESMKTMQAKMEEQKSKMSPEQRAMYEQGKMGMNMMPMMTGFMGVGGLGAGNTQPKSPIPSFRTRTVNNIACRHVDVFQGGNKVEALCVAEQGALNLAAEDFNTLAAMIRVTAELRRNGAFALGYQAPAIAQDVGNVRGFPVETVNLKTQNRMVISSIEANATIETNALQIPENYLEAKIPIPGMK